MIMNEKIMLAILGSPHANGMTATMLNCAIYKAEKMGYSVIRINLYDKNISYCTGCRACMNTQVCIQKDDIQEIVMYLQKCQTVLLAAPVYWANVPAPVKNLFDRLLGTAMEETSTFPFSWIFGQSRGAIHSMDKFFKTAGMKPIGKIVCSGTTNKKELPKKTIKKIERCIK